MSSRETILERISKNKPQLVELPDMAPFDLHEPEGGNIVTQFCQIATAIGAQVFLVDSLSDIKYHIKKNAHGKRIVTSITELADLGEHTASLTLSLPASLHNVDLAIIEGILGVAENAAIWVTPDQTGIRVLPFIAEHLVIVLKAGDIVADLHEAYKKTAESDFDFATFIAGPSKTADIEQSLVLGAHGARSLQIFCIRGE